MEFVLLCWDDARVGLETEAEADVPGTGVVFRVVWVTITAERSTYLTNGTKGQ